MWRGGRLAIVLLVTACNGEQTHESNDVDIGAAARAAAAYKRAPEPAASPTGALPSPPIASLPPATSTPGTVAQTPSTTDSAQGAADVVKTYFALIERGQYREAWRFWDRDGEASGMSAATFAASFDKYRDYHAEVGVPGRIDAGAGQRYVTVPVKVHGTLRSGDPFAMKGPITLHRTADIDGTTAAQRRWRIRESGMRPRPALASVAAPDRVVARYRCIDGSRFRVTFDNRGNLATLNLGLRTVALAGKLPASGIRYVGEGYELRGKDDATTLTRPDGPPLPCTVIR